MIYAYGKSFEDLKLTMDPFDVRRAVWAAEPLMGPDEISSALDRIFTTGKNGSPMANYQEYPLPRKEIFYVRVFRMELK